MTRRLVLAFALALAAACQKKPPPPCDDLRMMVDRLYAVERKGVESGMTAADTKRAAAVSAQVSGPMKEAITGACRTDGWSAEVVACMRAVASESSLDDCESKLTASQRKHIDEAIGEIVTRIQPPDEDPEDDSDTGVGVGESGIAACDDYAHAMQAYLDCEQVSEHAKGAARAALAQMRETWPMLEDPSVAASAKQAAAAACVDARKALAISASSMGCELAAATAATAPVAPPVADACADLGAMVDGLLSEQLRDVPAEAADRAAAMARQLADPMKHALVDACRRDRWSGEATRCLIGARSGAALAACEAKLSPAQAQHLGKAMQDVTTHIAGGASAGAGANAAASVPGCDAYLSEVNALLACDKLPAADRAALQRSMSMVVDGLHRLAGAAQGSIADTCTQARDSAHALAQKLGC